jgi:hypothetical protein
MVQGAAASDPSRYTGDNVQQHTWLTRAKLRQPVSSIRQHCVRGILILSGLDGGCG